jgi:hypothetical protein
VGRSGRVEGHACDPEGLSSVTVDSSECSQRASNSVVSGPGPRVKGGYPPAALPELGPTAGPVAGAARGSGRRGKFAIPSVYSLRARPKTPKAFKMPLAQHRSPILALCGWNYHWVALAVVPGPSVGVHVGEEERIFAACQQYLSFPEVNP